MKEKRKLSPLKVDQRIKFDGPCNLGNHEVCWGNRTKATIDSVDTLHGKLYIRFSDGDGGTISPRQVVSVLKPKKAPAAPERERESALASALSQIASGGGPVDATTYRTWGRTDMMNYARKALNRWKAPGFRGEREP